MCPFLNKSKKSQWDARLLRNLCIITFGTLGYKEILQGYMSVLWLLSSKAAKAWSSLDQIYKTTGPVEGHQPCNRDMSQLFVKSWIVLWQCGDIQKHDSDKVYFIYIHMYCTCIFISKSHWCSNISGEAAERALGELITVFSCEKYFQPEVSICWNTNNDRRN